MTGQQTRVVHCKKDRFDVNIGRPSKCGNPFTHLSDRRTRAAFIVRSREEAIQRYEEYLFSSGLISDIEELRGKVLGCWCRPIACHGDVLARLLNTLDENPTL
ncbi:MAG TPA: DUF4326 domain-containing protein [Pyrinomonadaceae bacterium]|nr:DUF4326 domain-containing protein [Pyrinomonadaceae bacterium]